MRTYDYKATRVLALRAACILSFAAVAAFGQVNLTAGPASATLPDGSVVPMALSPQQLEAAGGMLGRLPAATKGCQRGGAIAQPCPPRGDRC